MVRLVVSGPKHGTVSTYQKKKCRCDLCKSAWSEYKKKRRKQGLDKS